MQYNIDDVRDVVNACSTIGEAYSALFKYLYQHNPGNIAEVYAYTQLLLSKIYSPEHTLVQ